MFDHVTLRASDREASERFYDTVLATLGIGQRYRDDQFAEWEKDVSIAVADAEHPVTRGLHIAWSAPSRAEVDAFWQAGVDAGFRDDGYYAAFALDADGHNVEVVNR